MGTRALAFLALAGGAVGLWYAFRRPNPDVFDWSFPDVWSWAGGSADIDGGVYARSETPPRNTVEAFFRGIGLSPEQSSGIAAGIWAESRMDPTAVNPKSGAFGIGQWLGPRKAELFRRYGTRPTMAQQLEFLAWELGGGDHGGKHVLAQTTAHGTLDAYIRKFMRPAAGAETLGDLARGARYLG